MVHKQSLIALLAFFLFHSLFGQTIFSNNIDDNNPNNFNPYVNGQIVDPNLTVSGIGRGSGITGNNGNLIYNAKDWNLFALDAIDYFYFTLTPNPGYEIDFISFQYTGERNANGPTTVEIRSSLDSYGGAIGSPTITGTTIDLSASLFQNITGSITFRVYAWGGSNTNGTFSINDFSFNGLVSVIQCSNTVTWNGSSWSATPNMTTATIINGDYNTETHGSFSACSLTVNAGFSVTIKNNTYIEIENDVVVNGQMVVESQGSFVQNNDLASVTENGSITVEKITPPLNAWYEYVYWSSPVVGETIGNGLSDSDSRRRFKFNAQNFLDATMKDTNGAIISGQDDVDDNANDWQWLNGSIVMETGIGYASTHDEFIFNSTPGGLPKYLKYTFEGPFNNGTVTVPVYRNDLELNDNNWNLIGNPYPSAIDVDAFFSQNLYHATNNPTGTIEGAIYLWSHNTPPSSSNNGNERINFSSSDYAVINGGGETAGGDGLTPERYIPSGQGFFVHYANNGFVNSSSGNVQQGEVLFNNAMRIANATSNSQFFKNNSGKNQSNEVPNKLWVNLTSDNGVFSQILMSYMDGATDADDGSYYDAKRNAYTGVAASLYTTLGNSGTKYVIQGKNKESLDSNEIIPLGFNTSIKTATLYKLSIAQLQGDFLNSNTVYLKDSLMNIIHNLSASDYTFTSSAGEFNDRFQIVFSNNALSTNDALLASQNLQIMDIGSNFVNYKVPDTLKIKSVTIFDLLGRQIFNFKGENSSEIFELKELNASAFVSQVTLSDGTVITKKSVKR